MFKPRYTWANISIAPRIDSRKYEFARGEDAELFIDRIARKPAMVWTAIQEDSESFFVEVGTFDYMHDDQLEPLRLAILGRGKGVMI